MSIKHNDEVIIILLARRCGCDTYTHSDTQTTVANSTSCLTVASRDIEQDYVAIVLI